MFEIDTPLTWKHCIHVHWKEPYKLSKEPRKSSKEPYEYTTPERPSNARWLGNFFFHLHVKECADFVFNEAGDMIVHVGDMIVHVGDMIVYVGDMIVHVTCLIEDKVCIE